MRSALLPSAIIAHGAGYGPMWIALAVVMSGGIVASFRLDAGAGRGPRAQSPCPARAAPEPPSAELPADR